MTQVQIQPPYVLFLGDVNDPFLAKTAAGIAQWQKDKVVGQLRLADCKVDLGLRDVSLLQAQQLGAKSLVIGVANVGGQIQPSWIPVLVEALLLGLDVVSGMHTDLLHIPQVAAAAAQSKARVLNIRKSPLGLPIANGKKRQGRRLLTVGTDCAVGKKYSALAITQALCDLGMNATFRATGQTGIMIAGEGIAVDAVVADFIAGAAELISPANDSLHWDVIEGQGSLFNPSYSGVSLGLLHGSQPDAIVVCHDISRKTVSTCPDMAVPEISRCIDLHLQMARVINPRAVCVGVCVNTSSLSRAAAQQYLSDLSAQLGLPCVDPIADGCAAIASEINNLFPVPLPGCMPL